MFTLNLLDYFKRHRTTSIIFFFVIMGIITGLAMGEKARIFLPLGTIFLNLTFTIATPLIFFSIASTVANIISIKNIKRTMGTSVSVFLSMSFIATVFTLIAVKVFPIVKGVAIPLAEIDIFEEINIPGSIVSLFTAADFGGVLVKTGILPLIIFATLFGFSVKEVGEKSHSVKDTLDKISDVMYKMIDFLMYYAPIGLFGYFASFFGTASSEFTDHLTRSVFGFYAFAILFLIFFYGVYAYLSAEQEGIKSMKYLLLPSATAFATKSSLATLPINFAAANEMNIPKSISNISLSIGSIIHLEGSSMGVVLEIAFLSAVFGVPMEGFMFYINVLMIAIFIPLLRVGIPGGGGTLIESLIIYKFGFPMGALPAIILLNYLTDPILTVINATGNLVGSMVIARIMKGKGWIFRKDLQEDVNLKIYK